MQFFQIYVSTVECEFSHTRSGVQIIILGIPLKSYPIQFVLHSYHGIGCNITLLPFGLCGLVAYYSVITQSAAGGAFNHSKINLYTSVNAHADDADDEALGTAAGHADSTATAAGGGADFNNQATTPGASGAAASATADGAGLGGTVIDIC